MYRNFSIGILLAFVSFPLLSGPDPMQPARVNRAPKATERGIDKSHWHLSLIRHSGDVRVALLNGKLVNVGGRIQGALVSAIDLHQVTLVLPDDRLLKLELPSVRLRNGRD